MCTLKLTISQLSLAHGAEVKTDKPGENEKQLESVMESGGWKSRRTVEEKIYGKRDFLLLQW